MKNQEYRLAAGLELTQPKHLPEKSIFVISDLHLNHTNIIRYCNRPFDSVEDMNRVLINNWNYTVKPDDLVFFTGDFTFGKSDNYFPKLNGHIRFISGNHDKELDPDGEHKTLSYTHKGIDFFFIHETLKRQEKIPDGFDGWIIHGHHHNNNVKKFPFFCPEKRRINVSVELTKYAPVPLDYICELIEGEHKKIVCL